jgi:hypothetical protein
VLHAGLVPEHSAFVVHPATHRPTSGSHTGLGAAQRVWFAIEHSPQAPVGWHAGVPPPQSPSVLHALHLCVPVSHAGLVPEQFVLLVHSTHTPASVLHAGVAPWQAVAFVPEHWPHAPDGSHAGVGLAHSTSPAHTRHVRPVGSQIGVVPLHWALTTHATHTAAAVSHTGVAPVHRVAFVAEH